MLNKNRPVAKENEGRLLISSYSERIDRHIIVMILEVDVGKLGDVHVHFGDDWSQIFVIINELS